MDEAVLRHGLPLAGVELAAQLMRLAELAAIGRSLGVSALAAVCACLISAHLVMAPVAHVTSSVVAHLAVQPVGDGTVRRRRDGRAQAFAALALASLISLPISLLYFFTPDLIARLPLPPPPRVLREAHQYIPTLVWAVAPGLLQAAALGYLRAWQRLPTASLVIMGAALAYILLLPSCLAAGGLRAAAGAVAAFHAASLLLLLGFHSNAFRAREPPSTLPPSVPPPPAPPLATAAAERLRDLFSGFPFAALLATLRAGPAPMLLLFSLCFGCEPASVAALAILFALLQVRGGTTNRRTYRQHTHAHARTRTRGHTDTRARAHTHTNTWTHTRAHAETRTHAHTHTRTRTHTYSICERVCTVREPHALSVWMAPNLQLGHSVPSPRGSSAIPDRSFFFGGFLPFNHTKYFGYTGNRKPTSTVTRELPYTYMYVYIHVSMYIYI